MKIKTIQTLFGLAALTAGLLVQPANAQVLLSGGTYTQNFDTLANTGTANVWTEGATIAGWYTSRATSGPSFTQYRADTGSGNAGALYSYGATSSTQRALGLLVSSGTGNAAFGVRFTNDTANAMINFTVSFTAEQWRSANSLSQNLVFSYLIGNSLTNADAGNSQSWTPVSALNFTTPNNLGSTGIALDGTQSTNQQIFTSVVIPGASVQPGQEIFFRWYFARPSSGSSAGVAVDDLSVSFTATDPIPVPAFLASQPTNRSVYLGDFASFSILAGGTSPFTYQWYYTNTSGVTLLTDATNATLSLNFVTTNQAGGYFCAVTNAVGGTNSAVANLTVNVRTPIATTIAYLRTLLNPVTFAPTDTTNLYTVQGIVTTYENMTGGTPSTNAQYYIQDGAAGMTVFVRGGIAGLPAAGDRVQVTGPLDQFRGQLELNLNAANPAHTNFIVSNGNPMPAPTVFNLANANNPAYMKSIESSVVVVSNVFLDTSSGSGYFAGNNTVNMTNLNSLVFPIFVNQYVSSVIATPIPQFASSVTGVMAEYVASGTTYTNGFQLVPRQGSDLVAGTAPTLPIPLVQSYSSGSLTLQWSDASFTLQSSTNVAGPYMDVPGAASPFTTNLLQGTEPMQFFRLNHP